MGVHNCWRSRCQRGNWSGQIAGRASISKGAVLQGSDSEHGPQDGTNIAVRLDFSSTGDFRCPLLGKVWRLWPAERTGAVAVPGHDLSGLHDGRSDRGCERHPGSSCSQHRTSLRRRRPHGFSKFAVSAGRYTGSDICQPANDHRDLAPLPHSPISVGSRWPWRF